jgi:hypothetical protein
MTRGRLDLNLIEAYPTAPAALAARLGAGSSSASLDIESSIKSYRQVDRQLLAYSSTGWMLRAAREVVGSRFSSINA